MQPFLLRHPGVASRTFVTSEVFVQASLAHLGMQASKGFCVGSASAPVKVNNDMEGKASGKQQKLSFMGKLVRMLAESDPAVVRWNEAGTSFLVLDCNKYALLTLSVCSFGAVLGASVRAARWRGGFGLKVC